MGLRAWPEKNVYTRKGPPRDKNKALTGPKPKNKKQNKGPPRKKCKKVSVLSRKLRKK